jgi:ATP-dependent Clp protease adaptor protein ClpS
MSNASGLPETIVRTKTKTHDQTKSRHLPPYNVILENDDVHSCEFVVEVLCKALGYTAERSTQLMLQAHTTGRAVVWTGSKEVAELKADQIRTFHELRGPGETSLGPLGCMIEPAPG